MFILLPAHSFLNFNPTSDVSQLPGQAYYLHQLASTNKMKVQFDPSQLGLQPPHNFDRELIKHVQARPNMAPHALL
jgi:hypothetical protein